MEKFAHDLPFDPRYGCDLEALLKVPAPEGTPADFEAFWRDTYEETRSVPTNVVARPSNAKISGYRVVDVEYDSLGGFRVGGWALWPETGDASVGLICGHGYGGRDAPEAPILPRAAAIFPCGRGFNRSAAPGYPDNAAAHVIFGINDKNTYSHRGCVADLWQAATVLSELVPSSARRLLYAGASFGGGLGAMMLPWDDRIERGFLDVPSFGNHPLRVTLQCNGSGAAVKCRYENVPSILQTLAYFDAATASMFNSKPTLVAPALFDPAVPPPGQFAVYNALAGDKEIFVREAGHHAWSGEARESVLTQRAARAFLEGC
ncbi:MAG TPA: acetylxylan esterase [Tepidisphaeraceae bacterium]